MSKIISQFRNNKQIATGLDYLKYLGWYHGDVKPSNIIIISLSPLKVKLIDFNMSRSISIPRETGTIYYRPIEAIKHYVNFQTNHYHNPIYKYTQYEDTTNLFHLFHDSHFYSTSSIKILRPKDQQSIYRILAKYSTVFHPMLDI